LRVRVSGFGLGFAPYIEAGIVTLSPAIETQVRF